jgi:hypothetical protein
MPDQGFDPLFHRFNLLLRGDAQAIEGALSSGHVSWQGMVKNIEYLGLDDSIKKVVGIWWRRWVKVESGRRGSELETVPVRRASVGLKRGGRRRRDVSMSDDEEHESEADLDAEQGDDEAEYEGGAEEADTMRVDPVAESMSGALEAL